MPILQLSQHFIIHELQCPVGKKHIEYCDAEVPGLYVNVQAKAPGVGRLYLRWKNSTGKTCHHPLGRTSDVSLADARAKAKDLKAEISLGRYPQPEPSKVKSVPIFSAFFEQHALPYLKSMKRSWPRDEELYRLRIKAVFGDQRLDEINRQRVQVFHAGLAQEGLAPASADHHIKLMRRVLNLAVEWEMLAKNPLSRFKLFNADNKVEHYLDAEELERLLAVLRTDENRMICSIAMFLLSTGGRLNEALSAKWSEVDQQNRVWRIAATNSKSKRIRSVPLNDSAIDVLGQLDTAEDFDYLFVNRKTKQPYANIMKVWTRLRKKAELPHLRLHDLRHQYASFLVNNGRSLYEVQKILGHSDSKVTERYSHLSSKSLQDAANTASDMIKGSTAATA